MPNFVVHPECSCTTPMMYDIASGSYKNHQVQILSTEGMMKHVSKSDFATVCCSNGNWNSIQNEAAKSTKKHSSLLQKMQNVST